MADWPGPIGAITLFTEDLAATREFYQAVFGLPIHFQDDDSAVFDFGNVLVNLLRVEAAPDLVDPSLIAGPDAGVRMQFTVNVDDADAAAALAQDRGAVLISGPRTQPWGPRTATFRDPAGNVWEIAS